MENVLNTVPQVAERINDEFDAEATIIAILKDKQLGVGFTGVRGNKVLLALAAAASASVALFVRVAISGPGPGPDPEPEPDARRAFNSPSNRVM